MKILVNTISTKKHAGGAFQIAQNFLLRTLENSDIEWFYITSSDVDNVIGSSFEHLLNTNYFVFPTQPDFRGSYSQVKKQVRVLEEKIKPDVVYSITAPSYLKFSAPEVMRFTNPWVTHPNKYAWSVLSWKEKVHYYLYGLNQKRLMKAARFFITQTETCANGIKKIVGIPDTHVKVVSNVLPAVFKTLDCTPVCNDEYINIACVGAATAHKNFDLIPDILKEFKKLGYDKVRVHVTLPDDEPTLGIVTKKILEYGLSNMLVNHGRLSQQQLGEMYRRCQFCFLPTLLEVFSASTVEAMYYQLPIVATDFPFNSEILKDACLYYEPKNAKSAVEQFVKIIQSKDLQNEMKGKMKQQLALYGDYDAHFNAILSFLVQVGLGKL